MATLATETWTGTNGAAWPAQWTTTANGTGGATIQGNAGQITTGTGGYSFNRAYLSGMTASSNMEATVSFTTPSAVNVEMYLLVAIDADNTGLTGDTWFTQNGYNLELRFASGSTTGDWRFYKDVANVQTQLGSITSLTWAASTVYTVKMSRVGTTVGFKIWTGGSEPGSWTFQTTDSGQPSTGRFVVSPDNGADGVNRTFLFDNLTVTDGSTGPTFSGTLTTTGAGTVSFAGTPTASGPFTQTGSGALDLVGVSSSVVLTGPGTTAFGASTVSTSGAATFTGSGSAVFTGKPGLTGSLNATGSGALSTIIMPRLTGTVTLTGSGTMTITFVGATSITQVWTGTQWKNAPVWTWTGLVWKLGNLQIIHTLGKPVHGMYAGAGSTGSAAIDAFNTAKSTSIVLAQDIADYTTWQTLLATAPLTAWNTWCGVNSARRLVYSVGLLPTTDDPALTVPQKYQNLAFGLYDLYFTALGATFQSLPNLRNATIRLGARLNHAGLPWTLPSGDQDTVNLYKYAYNRVAALMRQACPGLTFEWCPNVTLDATQRTLADLYPGDGYVDFIGLTLSDYESGTAGVGASEATRFTWLQTVTNGLNDQVALGTARAKRLVLSDWGLVPSADPSHGGGDDPAFIDSVVAWLTANNYAYSVYNNTNLLNSIDSRLSSYTTAQAEYVSQFRAIGG